MRSELTKRLVFTFGILFVSLFAAPHYLTAENHVDVHTVGDYIGQEVVFTGVVELARKIESGTQFLDFGGRHPNAMFTCVVFASRAELFGDLTDYEGKTVRVRGIVNEFGGRPQIELKSPDQIELVDSQIEPAQAE